MLRNSILVLSFALTAFYVRAQQEHPHLEFEVASVKPSGTAIQGQRFRITHGALEVINMEPSVMIWNAYGLKFEGQISGVPRWADNEIFDIQAKSEEGPDVGAADVRKRTLLRLQSLPISRFALRTHWETRTMQGSVLSVGKGGSKLTPSAAETAFRTRQGAGELLCQHCAMVHLVGFLANYLKKPVQNDTGLEGEYDTNIEFAPLYLSTGDPRNERPTLSTVLRDRLGLKLESKKITLPVLVVDHIERPTAN